MVDFSEKISDFIIFLLKNRFYSQRKTDINKNLNCVFKKYTFFVGYQKMRLKFHWAKFFYMYKYQATAGFPPFNMVNNSRISLVGDMLN